MSAGFAQDGTLGGGLYLMCQVAYVGACVRGRLPPLAAGSVEILLACVCRGMRGRVSWFLQSGKGSGSGGLRMSGHT